MMPLLTVRPAAPRMSGSGDDAADLEVDDGVPVEAEVGQDRVAVLVELGRPAGRRPAPRRTAPAPPPAGTACRPPSRSPGGSRWRRSAGRRRPRACPARPPTGRRRPPAARATRRASPTRTPRSRIGAGLALLARSDSWSAKRGSVASSGRPMTLAQRRPVLARLEAGEGEHPAVLGLVVARSGLAPSSSVGRRRPRHVEHQRQRHRLAHGPQPGAEQRHVDDGGLAGALPVEERAHDPAGDRHAADRVAEARGRAAPARGRTRAAWRRPRCRPGPRRPASRTSPCRRRARARPGRCRARR